MSALSDSLHRASYASGAELSGQLCADIYGSCLAAEMTMAVLPFSTQELEQTAAFIGIAGDYARGSLRTSAQSGFDDAARRNFASLYKTVAELAQELSELRNEINDGDVLLDEPENVFADSGRQAERIHARYRGRRRARPSLTATTENTPKPRRAPAKSLSRRARPRPLPPSSSDLIKISSKLNTAPRTARCALRLTAAAYASMPRAMSCRSAPSAAWQETWSHPSLSR